MKKSISFFVLCSLMVIKSFSQDLKHGFCSMSGDPVPEINNGKSTSSPNLKGLCDANSVAYISKFAFSTSNFYKPGDQVPIRTMSLRFVIVQNSNGEKNFQNIPEHIDYLNFLVEKANGMYSGLDYFRNDSSACVSTLPSVNDSKIRLSLDTIVFVQDNEGWNCDYINASGDCRKGTCPDKDHYLVKNFGDSLHKSINVFFVEDSCFYKNIGEYNGTQTPCDNNWTAYAQQINDIRAASGCYYFTNHGCSWQPTTNMASIDASSITMYNNYARYKYDKYNGCSPMLLDRL